MNRSEKAILRKTIYAAAHHNKHLWWGLKWQISSFGYQSDYPRQYEFELPVRAALERLSASEREALINEWRKALPPRRELSNSEIISAYVRLVIDEIVVRARSAANRTSDW